MLDGIPIYCFKCNKITKGTIQYRDKYYCIKCWLQKEKVRIGDTELLVEDVMGR